MVTLKEKVFNRITDDFQVLTHEVFQQLELIERMMDDNDDEKLYAEIYNNERIIDSLEVKMRSEVINTIVLYTPRATNLRVIISYYDMTAYLERIGDLIMNIANFLRKTDIHGGLFSRYKSRLKEMLGIARRMTQNAIQAFVSGETALAKEVIELDDRVDEFFHSINCELIDTRMDDGTSSQDVADLLSVSSLVYNIERIGDNATNISEAAIYLIQGRNVRHLDHQDDADKLLRDNEE